jgi:hypothetical protein
MVAGERLTTLISARFAYRQYKAEMDRQNEERRLLSDQHR